MKKFICSNFVLGSTDGFEYTGEENDVVDKSVTHLVKEHGYLDSPQLREDVRNSLVPAS